MGTEEYTGKEWRKALEAMLPDGWFFDEHGNACTNEVINYEEREETQRKNRERLKEEEKADSVWRKKK